MRTASYSLNPLFPHNDITQRKGFLYAAWIVHNIYTYYVKYIWYML